MNYKQKIERMAQIIADETGTLVKWKDRLEANKEFFRRLAMKVCKVARGNE